MRTAEIRRLLDHLAGRGHTVVPSAPLPTPDATPLFVNAGMVPFKPYLTGETEAPWPRTTSVRKCARTLDIEGVGRTPPHGSSHSRGSGSPEPAQGGGLPADRRPGALASLSALITDA